jgi:menaquinone-specific isochorismate synthase
LREGTAGPWRIQPVEVEWADVDPLLWLDAQPSAAKIYWHGRGSDERVAATGRADGCEGLLDEALPPLESRLRRLEGDTRYYGGMRFDPARESAPEWAAFGASRFVLPRVELRQTPAGTRLRVNLVLPADAEQPQVVLDQVDRIAAPSPAFPPLPDAEGRRDAPGRRGWRAMIHDALAAFRRGDLGKVVLARRASFRLEREVQPLALLDRLERSTPQATHFFAQPTPGVAFLGATPERLVHRDGLQVRTEAVAGTRPRGESDADDARLAQELFESEKDQREHAFVREAVVRTLGRYSRHVGIDHEAQEMTLPGKRHLHSRIRATLRPGTSTLDLLRALHPTPAVGGTPTEDAVQWIRNAEPFDRGWYAGPVGWVGADGAEFAVAIRSGLVAGRTLALYSGAGIVEGSEPEAEWGEIETKLSGFAAVLGLAPQRQTEAA